MNYLLKMTRMRKLFVGMMVGLIISVNALADGLPDGGQVRGMVVDQNSKTTH
jgi:hypothetical protein